MTSQSIGRVLRGIVVVATIGLAATALAGCTTVAPRGPDRVVISPTSLTVYDPSGAKVGSAAWNSSRHDAAPLLTKSIGVDPQVTHEAVDDVDYRWHDGQVDLRVAKTDAGVWHTTISVGTARVGNAAFVTSGGHHVGQAFRFADAKTTCDIEVSSDGGPQTNPRKIALVAGGGQNRSVFAVKQSGQTTIGSIAAPVIFIPC